MCGTGPPYARWFLLGLILIASSLVSGSAVNRTIDDVNGDSVTGDLVQYLPELPASEPPLWFNQTSCSTCADIPDATFAFDNTWSAAQYSASVGSMSVSMKFTGTAIYVFFILPNFSATSLVSTVVCDFFIDGVAVGSFLHQSDGSDAFLYNALVYQNTSISDGDHVFLIETTGTDPAVIIFDYALYTFTVDDPPDPPDPPPPSATLSSSSSPIVPTSSTTSLALPEITGSTASQSPSSTQIEASLVFSTSAETTASMPTSSIAPFVIPDMTDIGSSPTATPLSPTPVTNPSSDDSSTGASQRSTSVIAIVGAIVGAIILVVLAFLFIILCRRKRARSATTGTISVFDLLDDNSHGQLSTQTSIQASLQAPLQPSPIQTFSDSSPSPPPARRRALPTPPMSQHGRLVDATQTKTETQIHSPAIIAGPSGTGSNLRGDAQMFNVVASGSGSGYHSSQSSVSSYSNPRSELTIHIPMTSFRPSHSPSTSNSHSHSHSFNNGSLQGHSHSHTNSQSHGYSPITRHGVPMPPEEADIVRGIVLGSLALVDTASIRAYSPTVETDADDDDDPWAPPVMHVDSGIRISRQLMELPPQYAAA